MWRQQHVVGHHAYTNVDGLDPDIRVSGQDVRRVTAAQPWHSWHTLQHVYLGALYGLLAFKSIYVDDFVALFGGDIGPVRLSPQTRAEAAVFWGGKVVYASYMLAVPLLWSHHSLLRLLALWALADGVTGWMLAFMFQVAHVVDEVAYPKLDVATGRVALGWAAGQVATTADFCHGSSFWTHVSGGLNYQARNVCVRHAARMPNADVASGWRAGCAPPLPRHLPLPLPAAGAYRAAHGG
jgi:fatty acid desaturase